MKTPPHPSDREVLAGLVERVSTAPFAASAEEKATA